MGNGSWEHGWTILATRDEHVVATRGGLRLWLRPGQYELADGAEAEEARVCSVRSPKELCSISAGYYVSLGDVSLDEETREVLRLYWSITPDGAAPLVRAITTGLNRNRVPFRFKVADDPSGYRRCDAGVLYLPRAEYPQAAEVVESAYAEVRAWLRDRTPALVKRLAPGLGTG